MKINVIAVSQFTNDRHFQFFRNFCLLVERFGADALHVAALFAQLLARFAREDEALKKIVASPITKRIADADKARDNTFSGMVEITHAYLKYYDPVVAEAARRLKILFNTYGNIAKKPVKEETSAVYNMRKPTPLTPRRRRHRRVSVAVGRVGAFVCQSSHRRLLRS